MTGVLTIPSEQESAAANIARRFYAKVYKTETCWLWTGYVDKQGYARLKGNGKNASVVYAHRYSYESHVGPIPPGLTIDHLCRVRHCVNPAHLEAVTPRENMLRGVSPGALAVRRNTCRAGHPYDYRSPSGSRICRTCTNERERIKYALRRKEAKAA